MNEDTPLQRHINALNRWVKIYAHVLPSMQEQAADAVDRLFGTQVPRAQ